MLMSALCGLVTCAGLQAIESNVGGLPGVDLNNPEVKNAIDEAAKGMEDSKKDKDDTKY